MSACRLHALASPFVFWLVGCRVGCFAYKLEASAACRTNEALVTRSATRLPRVLLQVSSGKIAIVGSTLAESSKFQEHLGQLRALQESLNSSSGTRKLAMNEDSKFMKGMPSPRVSLFMGFQRKPANLDEEGEVRKSLHVAVAVMLLGFVAFVMALFYLVNFPDDDIQAATWRLLSTTMSIFLAVLMFSGTQHLLAFLTGSHESEGESEHQEVTAAIGHAGVTRDIISYAFVRFICFWLGLQIYTYFVHSRYHSGGTLKAIATLGSHIVAFSGMDAFGTLQEEGFFSGNLYHCIAGVLVLGVIIWGLFYLAKWLRSLISQRTSDPEAMEEWLAECNSAQHESASLILGLMISQCIRFGITGSLPPLEGGSPMGKTSSQVHTLFAIAAFLGLAVVALEISLKRTIGDGDQTSNKGRFRRALRVVRETLSMTMAWCLTYWGRWAFWMSTGDSGLGYGDKMTALLATSLFMSAFCFGCLLAIDFIAGRLVGENGIHGLIILGNSLGLVLGLAWEETFHEAVGAIGSVHLFPIGYELNVLVLICILVTTTLPAWMLYILPEASRDRGQCFFKSEAPDDF